MLVSYNTVIHCELQAAILLQHGYLIYEYMENIKISKI